MTKKELAALLGISGAMVSRLAKRGMPVDDVERAKRWRRRHLEPGRVKGARYDPSSVATPPTTAVPAPGAVHVGEDTRTARALFAELLEITATDTHAAVTNAPDGSPLAMVEHLRHLLRAVPAPMWPRLTAATWVALLDHMLADGSPLRSQHGNSDRMTLDEFSDCGALWPGVYDWEGYAIHGYTEDDDG